MKKNYFRQILKTFEQLKKSHPKCEIAKHIATAMDGQNVWGISDESFLKALKEYQAELEIDVKHSDDDIDDIIRDGMNINKYFLSDEDQEDFYE